MCKFLNVALNLMLFKDKLIVRNCLLSLNTTCYFFSTLFHLLNFFSLFIFFASSFMYGWCYIIILYNNNNNKFICQAPSHFMHKQINEVIDLTRC